MWSRLGPVSSLTQETQVFTQASCTQRTQYQVLRRVYTCNVRSETCLAREIEHVLIWRKQRKKWPMTSLEFVMWHIARVAWNLVLRKAGNCSLLSADDGYKVKHSEKISPSSACMHAFKVMGRFYYELLFSIKTIQKSVKVSFSYIQIETAKFVWTTVHCAVVLSFCSVNR